VAQPPGEPGAPEVQEVVEVVEMQEVLAMQEVQEVVEVVEVLRRVLAERPQVQPVLPPEAPLRASLQPGAREDEPGAAERRRSLSSA